MCGNSLANSLRRFVMATTEIEKSRYKKWYEANKDRVREMKRASMAKRRELNPDIHRAQYRKAKAKERESLYAMYGHLCASCGFSDKRALSLDHKRNNGNLERSEIGERGVYRKALACYAPDEYQILCMNCQFIKQAEARSHSVQQQPGEH